MLLGALIIVGTLLTIGFGVVALLLLDRRKYNRAIDETEKLKRTNHIWSVLP